MSDDVEEAAGNPEQRGTGVIRGFRIPVAAMRALLVSHGGQHNSTSTRTGNISIESASSGSRVRRRSLVG